ncbi:MAG: hypothetical protein ACR2NM_09125 [Bythopirellula sp.]
MSDAKRDLQNDPRHQELIEWLKSQGHNDQQINLILKKVAEYDSRTIAESIFDSIDSGDFSIAALIDEALTDES